MNKRVVAFGGVAVVCCILLGVVFMLANQKETFVFQIKNKVTNSLKETYEFGDKIGIQPNEIHLTAKLGDQDVTKNIRYTKVKFNDLRTYKIKYKYQEHTFVRTITIIDKTNPIITGKESLEITQGDTFDISLLELHGNDNYDGDISGKIEQTGNVDTATVGSYGLTFTLKDSSGNTASLLSTIQVVEKSKIVENSPMKNEFVITNPDSITALVNKKYILPDGWAPSDLTSIENGFYLRAEAAQAWNRMMSIAASEGVTMNAVSAYRSQAYQTNLYYQYYASDPINAPYFSALPRRSEHELGLALDISYGDFQLHEDLESTPTGIWLDAHGHEFGWIMRYPSGKTNITGYIYEAWHYRYVGADLAMKVKASGLTLEEYLGE